MMLKTRKYNRIFEVTLLLTVSISIPAFAEVSDRNDQIEDDVIAELGLDTLSAEDDKLILEEKKILAQLGWTSEISESDAKLDLEEELTTAKATVKADVTTPVVTASTDVVEEVKDATVFEVEGKIDKSADALTAQTVAKLVEPVEVYETTDGAVEISEDNVELTYNQEMIDGEEYVAIDFSVQDELEALRIRIAELENSLQQVAADQTVEDTDMQLMHERWESSIYGKLDLATVRVAETELMSAPEKTASQLAVLKQGDKIAVEYRSGNWYRVVTEAGVRAWIRSEDIYYGIIDENSLVRVKGFDASIN